MTGIKIKLFRLAVCPYEHRIKNGDLFIMYVCYLFLELVALANNYSELTKGK